MSDIVLTCNIIASRRENIITQLKRVEKYFDTIRVLNSAPEDALLKRCIDRFDVEYYERAFDYPSAQFNFILSKAEVGEWYLYLSDDELPSVAMLENLYNLAEECEASGKGSVWFPLLAETEYRAERSVSERMEEWYANRDKEIGVKYGIPEQRVDGQLRFMKVHEELRYADPVHGHLKNYGEIIGCPYPLIHRKPSFGHIKSCLWQSVLDNGALISKDVQAELLEALSEAGVGLNFDEINRYLAKGNVSEKLKQWIWQYKGIPEKKPYCRSWFIVYYFVYHPEELPEDFWDAELIRLFNAHILIERNEADVMRTAMPLLMKEKYLARASRRF